MMQQLSPANTPLAAPCSTAWVKQMPLAGMQRPGTTIALGQPATEPVQEVCLVGSLSVSAPARSISSHVLQSPVDACVAFTESSGNIRCLHSWFHWNGAELVVCAVGTAPWSGLDQARVCVSLPVTAVSPADADAETLARTTQFVEFPGRATSDSVIGVAPEHRAAAVRYLGPSAGHQHSDNLQVQLVALDEPMHRLFVTPLVPVDDSSRDVD